MSASNANLMDNHGQSNDMQNNEFATKWRQNRACARCRRLKMKCAFEDPSYKACRRCFAINVECSFDTDPTAKYARKKQRKATTRFVESVAPGITSEAVTGSRTGDQISQLQNLIKLVLTSLSSLEHDLAVTSIESEDGKRLSLLNTSVRTVSEKLNKIMNSSNATNLKQFQDFHKSPSMENYPYIPFNSNIAKEIIEKHQLISLEEFKIRHQFFLNEMLPYYPIISLSKNHENFDYLYENDPLLLLACVYVTSINDNGLYSTIKENFYRITNESLNQMLNYYLESFISYHVYIKSDNFTYQLVNLCLILSLWCLPTTTSGHFKNQLNLLIGFNISLCIDLGDITKIIQTKNLNTNQILADDSEARNHLRAFLSVYVSCGSLGLSLPRFKLVSWTKNHHSAINLLMKEGEVNGVKLPSRNDTYLCYFARVIRLGQEIFEYFSPSLFDSGIAVNGRKRDALFNNMLDPSNSPLSHLKFVLDNYEQRMYVLLVESGFMTSPEPHNGANQPKEKYLLSIIYYQLLMIIYDNIVSKYFVFESKLQNQPGQQLESVTYIQYIVKLIKICENLLNSFITLGRERTINLPTFFFYRPMHSLILLIKLRILINSSGLSKRTSLINPEDLSIDAESYFNAVSSLIHHSQQKFSSIVCSRMSIILSRIEKWMQLSNGKKSDQPSRNEKNEESSNLVSLIDTSKEIENLRAPKEVGIHSADSSGPSTAQSDIKETEINHNSSISNGMDMKYPTRHLSQITTTPSNLYANSIQEIFETIDSDLLNYLNPLEANIELDSTFNELASADFNLEPMNLNVGMFNNGPKDNHQGSNQW